MATCSNVPNRANSMDFNQNMPLSECMCPICMSILVEPVTLPCKHELCMPCFRLNIHETSMTCPMCRIRIATWSRQAARKNTLVNQKRWNQIKKLFPEQVNKRLAGMDEDDLLREAAITPTISEPGEIRKEYEEEMKRLEDERERQRQAELAASEALIRQLQEEENQLKESWKKRKTKQMELDEVVAREMAESVPEPQTRTMRSQKKGLMDKFVIRSPSGAQPDPTPSGNSTNHAPPAGAPENQPTTSGATSSGHNSNQPATSRTNPDLEKPSTSKFKSSFLDFFQPPTNKVKSEPIAKIEPKSAPTAKVISDEPPADSEHEQGTSTGAITTSVVIDVKSRTDPKTAKSSQPDAKASDSKHIVHSFVDKKLSEAGTSKGDKPVCKRADSTDSISQELVHFQPIQACPRTPPKRMPSGRLMHAPVIKCKPLNLPSPEPVPPTELTSKSEHHSPVIRRQVALLEAQRLARVDEQSKAEQTDTNILQNRSPASPFRTISIGQKRRHGIEKSPATKKLRFDLGGSDASDAYNVTNSQVVNCLRKKLEKPEIIIIDSESTQSSCIIIEEKSTMKPQPNGAFQKIADWLDSMGDENNSENSDGGLEAVPAQKREPAPVYVMANRLKFNPPRESPAVNKNVDDWLRRSQAENEDKSRVQPIDTARRCFSNPGRTILPQLTREYVLKRASEGEDRSRSVCSVLKANSNCNDPPKLRPNKTTQQTTLFKGKKVPNKDNPKSRNTNTNTASKAASSANKSKSKNTKTKPKPNTRRKAKKTNTNTNHRVVSPRSGEEAGAESDEDPDLKLARKLQKQYDLEARTNMTIYKVRGSDEDYSFRKRTNKSESS